MTNPTELARVEYRTLQTYGGPEEIDRKVNELLRQDSGWVLEGPMEYLTRDGFLTAPLIQRMVRYGTEYPEPPRRASSQLEEWDSIVGSHDD